MKSIIFALLIGCSKKTETSSSANVETENSAATNKDDVQIISLSPNSTTKGDPVSASPTNSIEIKAIVRPETTETTEEKEDLPLPEDADDINDTVDPD